MSGNQEEHHEDEEQTKANENNKCQTQLNKHVEQHKSSNMTSGASSPPPLAFRDLKKIFWHAPVPASGEKQMGSMSKKLRPEPHQRQAGNAITWPPCSAKVRTTTTPRDNKTEPTTPEVCPGIPSILDALRILGRWMGQLNAPKFLGKTEQKDFRP